MTWRLNVDKNVCMATGMCAALAPELFQLDDAHSTPVREEVEPTELALDAAEQCPTQAITVVADGRVINR